MKEEEEKRAPGAPAEGASPASAPGGELPPEEAVRQLEEKLAAREEECRQYHDRLLRERAELENYKKRAQRDRVESLRFASEGLIRDLLSALDDLERAIEHAEFGGNGQPLVDGVRLAHKQALNALEAHGVTRIDARGQDFDPAVHEAMAQVPAPDRPANQVVDQYRPGYTLHGRLLRPAQVTVSSGPPVENPPNDD